MTSGSACSSCGHTRIRTQSNLKLSYPGCPIRLPRCPLLLRGAYYRVIGQACHLRQLSRCRRTPDSRQRPSTMAGIRAEAPLPATRVAAACRRQWASPISGCNHTPHTLCQRKPEARCDEAGADWKRHPYVLKCGCRVSFHRTARSMKAALAVHLRLKRCAHDLVRHPVVTTRHTARELVYRA